jgi:hypothetical protein
MEGAALSAPKYLGHDGARWTALRAGSVPPVELEPEASIRLRRIPYAFGGTAFFDFRILVADLASLQPSDEFA